MTDLDDLSTRIDNAIGLLRAQLTAARGAAIPALQMAVAALQAAKAAVAEMASQLDLVTAPELDAAAEIRRLRAALEAEAARAAALEQELGATRAALEVEQQLRAEDGRRVRELEQRVAAVDDLLANDPRAFGAFMDKALDEHDRQRRGRRQ